MAARRSETSTSRKEEILDTLEGKFVRSVKNYVSDVKATIRAGKADTAEGMFLSALAFLSQVLPDHTCQARDRQTKNYESAITEEVKAADSMTSEVLYLTTQLETLKNKVQALESKIDLSEASRENSDAMKRLRKLLVFLKNKNQI